LKTPVDTRPVGGRGVGDGSGEAVGGIVAQAAGAGVILLAGVGVLVGIGVLAGGTMASWLRAGFTIGVGVRGGIG